MKPRQKCGSSHWLTEECPKGICELKVFGSPLSKMVVCPEEDLPAAAEEFAAEVVEPIKSAVKSALTAAQKQKAYRDRILADSERADEYRKRNAERLRRKRGG